MNSVDLANLYTTLVTEKIPAAYEAGYEKGKAEGGGQGDFEAGKQAEREAFWEIFQQGGNPMSYNNAFSYGKFTDENYYPVYPINCSDGTLTSTQMFYNAYYITDTKVDIYASSKRLNQCFSGATGLVTIRGLHLYETTTLDTAFGQCNALENIKIYGAIGQTVSFQWSKKLKKHSITNSEGTGIMDVLSKTATGMTLTLSKEAVDREFETSEGANDGSTSSEWIALKGSKSNWTITLV